MKAAAEMCACGQPLHYSDPDQQRKVQSLVDSLGPLMPVSVQFDATGDRRFYGIDAAKLTCTWMVPRHYIALHGLVAAKLPELARTLGFQEVFSCPKCRRISHNPNDLANRYCGHCHEFF
jgi:hypothetical protein